jgi:hypothetical protein
MRCDAMSLHGTYMSDAISFASIVWISHVDVVPDVHFVFSLFILYA